MPPKEVAQRYEFKLAFTFARLVEQWGADYVHTYFFYDQALNGLVASWLLDLTAAAFVENPTLEGFAGRVSDSGEGRWTVLSAVAEGVPAPVLSAALYARFDSRGRDDFANQVLSAMRQQFGGHHEKTETE